MSRQQAGKYSGDPRFLPSLGSSMPGRWVESAQTLLSPHSPAFGSPSVIAKSDDLSGVHEIEVQPVDWTSLFSPKA